MPICHEEIDLDGSACPEVFQDTDPALFALLGTGSQRQHLLSSLQVHAPGDEDHSRISLVSLTHTEMDQRPAREYAHAFGVGAHARR